MSDFLEALILGIIQGLTEFLPVSSSGHLEIAKFLFNNQDLAEQSLLTSILLHFATALATVVVFRKDILKILQNLFSSENNPDKRFVIYIIISMLPAAIVGFFFNELIEQFYQQKIVFVGIMLLITGLILLLSERLTVQSNELNITRSFIIGLSQAFALLPGISRSGATIGTSLLLGINKKQAARFSFLMVVPLIFGKVAKDMLSGDLMANMPAIDYLAVGFIAAFISGLLACTWMLKIVQNSKLFWFAIYCFVAGSGIISYYLFT